MNRVIPTLFLPLCQLFASCSFLMIGPDIKPSSFKYFNPDFKLENNAIIRMDGFYFYKLESEDKRILYFYLRFYDDGRINSKLTAGEPNIIKETYWPFNDVFGYYMLEHNTIKYELKARYDFYELAEGTIINDTLKVKILNVRQKGKTTYYRDYIFHQGFAP